MVVPFVDLYAQYLSIKEEIDACVAHTIRHSSYIGGSSVDAFGEAFADWLGVPFVVPCANGTDSIELILKAAGIGPGDEVIVPAMSWISTSEAVSSVGAVPVFADVDEHFLLDLDRAREVLTPRTRAIIPVHLYGNPVDMHAVMGFAHEHRLFVLEDCAQSHGASVKGRKTGTFGHAASFSFYPGKNLGAYGDAGAVATPDEDLAARIRMLANHGQQGKHNHLIEGRNSRMDGLQAAILLAKLPHLDNWTALRRQHAAWYTLNLASARLILPSQREGFEHVFHLYVVQCEQRDGLMSFLSSKGVQTAIHYPTPLPLLPCYADRVFTADAFPMACRSSRILSLPMFAELTTSQLDHVAGHVHEFLSTHHG